jgi:hypothetical protein
MRARQLKDVKTYTDNLDILETLAPRIVSTMSRMSARMSEYSEVQTREDIIKSVSL